MRALPTVGAHSWKQNRHLWLAFSTTTTQDPSRRLQIQKAKQQLVGSTEQHPEIQEALSKGFVKPYFHTLLLPETFLRSRRSFTKVIGGDEADGVYSGLDFFAESLDVSETITDDGVESAWEFSTIMTNFAVQLVNTDADMLGEGVEATKLTTIPIMEVNPSETVSCDLLTRPESRGVVSNIFHRFSVEPDVGLVASITGSEGIGKSWTLLYALQQALFYEEAKVLFFFQKSNDAVLFLRSDDNVYAWTSKSRPCADSNLFKRPDVLVLLDPNDADQGGANFATGRRKLLYVTNNNAHIPSAVEKTNPDMQAFLGPPLDGEMNVILKRIDPTLQQDVIKERAKHVGNLLRYVLQAKQYSNRVEATAQALEACADEPTLLQQALRAKGMSNGSDTIPGTLFQVLPTRPLDLKDIGYDGQEVKYRERVVQAVNEEVHDAILSSGRRAILTYNPNGMAMKRYQQGENGQWDESDLDCG